MPDSIPSSVNVKFARTTITTGHCQVQRFIVVLLFTFDIEHTGATAFNFHTISMKKTGKTPFGHGVDDLNFASCCG